MKQVVLIQVNYLHKLFRMCLIAYHYIKVIVLNVTIIQTKGTKMAPLFIHVFSKHLLIVLTLENLHQISWIELQRIEIVLCC